MLGGEGVGVGVPVRIQEARMSVFKKRGRPVLGGTTGGRRRWSGRCEEETDMGLYTVGPGRLREGVLCLQTSPSPPAEQLRRAVRIGPADVALAAAVDAAAVLCAIVGLAAVSHAGN